MEIIGLVINDNEKDKLRKLCTRHNIPLLYKDLFDDDNSYHLWAFNEGGIALAGTIILSKLKIVLHGTTQMELFLSNYKFNED